MEVKIYKCFIGSPGDTIEERKYCKEVFNQINKTIGEKFNFRLESLMWEDDSRPAFGIDGQDVINRQLLLKEYHVFIGIMWSRFGTPTKRAESGTVEEFEDAYQKFKEKRDLEICMYFNKKDFPQSNIDTEQITQVFRFKKRVSELGGLYNEYNGAEQFKDNLRDHLTRYFLDKHGIKTTVAENINTNESTNEIISAFLNERLTISSTMFNGQKTCWIDPILSKTNLISSNYSENYDSRVNLDDIIANPASIIIKSPPQFGLTCLSHFLILNAWGNNNVWIY